MEEKKVLSTLADVEQEMNVKVELGNKLIGNGVLTADFLSVFDELGALYAEKKKNVVYDELLQHDDPIFAAIEKPKYFVSVVRQEKKKGIITGLYIDDEVERTVGLLDFCKRAKRKGVPNVNAEWDIPCSLFNQSLCLREALRLDLDVESVANSYYLKKKAAEISTGGNPVSDDNLLTELQNLLDKIYFKDNGEGANIFVAEQRDVNYLLGAYTKKDRKALTLAISKDAGLQKIIHETYTRIVTEGNHNIVGYRTVEQQAASQAKLNAKREEKKAEKEAKEAAEKAAAEVKTIIETPLDFDFNFEPLGELESISATA